MKSGSRAAAVDELDPQRPREAESDENVHPAQTGLVLCQSIIVSPSSGLCNQIEAHCAPSILLKKKDGLRIVPARRQPRRVFLNAHLGQASRDPTSGNVICSAVGRAPLTHSALLCCKHESGISGPTPWKPSRVVLHRASHWELVAGPHSDGDHQRCRLY